MTLRKVTTTMAAGLLVAVATPALAASKDKDNDADGAKDAPIAIPAPPPGKGQIVFYRPGGMGFALGCSVNENGQKISSLGAGKYFIMVADPGKHEYSVKSEAKDTLGLLVEADETQYAMCKIKMGIMVGRPDIAPSDEASFRKQKHLKMVNEDDMGPGPGALRPEQVAAALSAPAQPAVAQAPTETAAAQDGGTAAAPASGDKPADAAAVAPGEAAGGTAAPAANSGAE